MNVTKKNMKRFMKKVRTMSFGLKKVNGCEVYKFEDGSIYKIKVVPTRTGA